MEVVAALAAGNGTGEQTKNPVGRQLVKGNHRTRYKGMCAGNSNGTKRLRCVGEAQMPVKPSEVQCYAQRPARARNACPEPQKEGKVWQVEGNVVLWQVVRPCCQSQTVRRNGYGMQ